MADLRARPLKPVSKEKTSVMPAKLELTATELLVHVQGADRVWAFKRHLQIPLRHVIAAHPAREEARRWLHGMRLGGTHIPRRISAGRFYSDGEMAFWDVRNPDKAIEILLEDERFHRLVLEVEHPGVEIARIRHATAQLVA